MNPTVDWYIITDNDDKYDYPSNVHKVMMTFDEVHQRFNEALNMDVALSRPYKFCDLRPTFGYVFPEIIEGYDFWGWCDVDLIWGDIRHFFTDALLDRYDRISYWGHCSLCRNNELMNNLFRVKVKCLPDYKQAYISDLSFLFDEKIMRYICNQEKIKVFDNTSIFFDANFHVHHFEPNAYQCQSFLKDSPYVFEWNKGMLTCYYEKNNKLDQRKLLYLHMQKRPIKVLGAIDYNQPVYIFDNKISNKCDAITTASIKRLSPHALFHLPYLKDIWHRIKVKIFHCSGVNVFTFPKGY